MGENYKNHANYLFKNILEIPKGSLIINITYSEDKKFIGVPVENMPEIIQPKSCGDYFMVNYNDNLIFSCTIRKFNVNDNSHSDISKLFNKLSNNNKLQSHNHIYFNLMNLKEILMKLKF